MKKLLVAALMAFMALSYPAACLATPFSFHIDVQNQTVTGSGLDYHIISDQEINAFGITDAVLKDGVNKYFGKAPKDAYLKSPTPGHGDLYKKFGWPQVETQVQFVSATLQHTEPETVLVSNTTFGPADSDGTITVSLEEDVSNTTEHTWSSSNSVTVSQSISYLILPVRGNTAVSYTHQWGESKTEIQAITLKATASQTQPIKKGQTLISELSAQRSSLTVTVKYQAALNGCTAVHYNPKYKGPKPEGDGDKHYFYALPISSVIFKAGLPLTREITETITIYNYYDASIRIYDKNDPNKTTIRKIPVQMIHHPGKAIHHQAKTNH